MLEISALLVTILALMVTGMALWGRIKQPKNLKAQWLRGTLLAVVIVPTVLLSAWRISNSRKFQFFGVIVPRVETTEKLVALTFDDGPTQQYTPLVLDMLKKEKVKATFFVIGEELEQAPQIGQRIVAEGHELGNHTYSHTRMIGRSYAFVRDEVERTDALIRTLGYKGPITFRPPYGKKFLTLPYYLNSTDRTTITWDVEPDSALNATSTQIVDAVKAQVRPGSIILLHAMYSSRQSSQEAIPGIIEALRGEGYKFVTVSELLAHASKSSP